MGNRTGVLTKYLYQDGRLSGVADRNDNQVLWYETNDDGLVTAVFDKDNRLSEYSEPQEFKTGEFGENLTSHNWFMVENIKPVRSRPPTPKPIGNVPPDGN